MNTNPIPMIDPAAEYRSLKPEIDAAVGRVLASGRYVLGPEGEALERELAAYTGATPVFVDVDAATFNIEPGSLGKSITKKTKAVIAVHLFGQCAALDEI